MLVMGEVVFDGKAPPLERVVEKLQELSGVRVSVHPHPGDIPNLYDQQVDIYFACLPEERIEISSFLPGAAKKYYEDFQPGFTQMPIANHALGLNEAPGTQVVYLRSFVVEPTLMVYMTLALEALGGRARMPMSDAERRAYSSPITEQQLLERRRKTEKQLRWASVLFVVMMPIYIPLMMFGLLVSLVMMPFRLWKAWGMYRQFDDTRAHAEFMSRIPQQMEFYEADKFDFPQLDEDALVRYTLALENLGFVFAMDYSIHTEVPPSGSGFGRLFFHPEHLCIAELNQVFPEFDAPSDLRMMFGTLFSDGWDLTTTDRMPYPLMYAWRRPRGLWTCHPHHTVGELLAEHLQRRQEMMDVLQITITTALTAEAYFSYNRLVMADRRSILAVKTMSTINEEMGSFQMKPKLEWLGDFGKKKMALT